MALGIRTYRSFSIDASNLNIGEILAVQFENGRTINLLPVRDYDGQLRWIYAKRSWLAGDKRAIESLMQRNQAIHALDGFGTIHNGRVDAYVRWQFLLDAPLQFEVRITWEPDHKNRDRSRELGILRSAGGLVTNVTASTVSALACS